MQNGGSFISERERNRQLEEKAKKIELTELYQPINGEFARAMGYTRSSTVKRFVLEDNLSVYSYFHHGKWMLAITQQDATCLLVRHRKVLTIGTSDICGLCGIYWTVQLNIHKTVLANGVHLYLCTRCRNVKEVCDDPMILRSIADGLERAKK